MKTFLAGLACGVLLSIAAITYLEFTQESTGGFTSYVQPLLSQINDVILTEANAGSDIASASGVSLSFVVVASSLSVLVLAFN